MPDMRFDTQAPRAGSDAADQQENGRQPFVSPTVEEMGGLKELTRLGGTL